MRSLSEFPHTAVTGIAMALNLVPVTSVLYLGLRGQRTAAASLASSAGSAASSSASMLPAHSDALPRTTSLVMLVFGLQRSSTRPRLQSVCLYAFSLGLLALYTAMLALHSEELQRAAILAGSDIDSANSAFRSVELPNQRDLAPCRSRCASLDSAPR